MSSNHSTTYLISGANRGIGFGIVEEILKSDSTAVVFAGARDVAKATDLHDLAKKYSNLHVVELIADDKSSNVKAVEKVKEVVSRLDVVITNAAIGGKLFHVGEIDGLDAQNVYNVNTLGHIYLYRAAYPIFVANRKAGDGKPPVFLAVSRAGSIGSDNPFSVAAYGMSKAALNWAVRHIHSESNGSGLVAIPWHPGMISSESAKDIIKTFQQDPRGAQFLDFVKNLRGGELLAPMDTCTKNAFKLITTATRESAGGKFVDAENPGQELPW